MEEKPGLRYPLCVVVILNLISARSCTDRVYVFNRSGQYNIRWHSDFIDKIGIVLWALRAWM